jgi:hypothetical protein
MTARELGFVVSHPIAKCAIGWGTLFRAPAKKKQILPLHFVQRQDDGIRGVTALDSQESSVQ